MFTQCPDCRKVYPLDSQLNPEDKTRMHCGTCAKDFNVLALLTENPLGILPQVDTEIVTKPDAKAPAKPKTRTKNKHKKNRSPAKIEKTEKPSAPVPQKPVEITPVLMSAAEAVFIPAANPTINPAINNEDDQPYERLPWEKASPTFKEALDTLGLFNNEQISETPSNKPDRRMHNVLNDRMKPVEELTQPAPQTYWHMANLCGLLVLIGQLFCYASDDFSQSHLYRPYLEKICHWAGCSLRTYANINEFEVLQGSFKTNPDKNISFKAVISNQAPFKQKLPDVKLTLVNVEEHMFAQRFFKPEEYLIGKNASQDISPDESKEVQLIITEPKTPIGGYFFDLTY